jgi:hypothetical protein
VTRPRTGKAFLASLTACLSLGLAACSNIQLVPGPLDLPPPHEVETQPTDGPQTIVVRHASPVWIYRPGATAGYPLPFYRKRERVTSGSAVRVGWGGRAELVWPGDATSIVMFEETRVDLGDPSRDQALVVFNEVTRAQLILTPEDRIILVGGAELRGDPVQPSGPFLLDRIGLDLLRVTNQSKFRGRLLYRDAVLELAPGDSIDVPVLSIGSAPYEVDPGLTRVASGGIELEVLGNVDPSPGTNAVHLKALGLSEVSAQGIQIRLARDEEAVFASLQGQVSGGGVDPAPEQP